jgi:hypothetical protein
MEDFSAQSFILWCRNPAGRIFSQSLPCKNSLVNPKVLCVSVLFGSTIYGVLLSLPRSEGLFESVSL